MNSLTWLKDDEKITEVIRKLSLGIKLESDESVLCLAVAIFFIKTYQVDKRRSAYLEFGYALILSYSLLMDDLEPLYDLATNLGFYPISKVILRNNTDDSRSFSHYFLEKRIEKYSYKDITETLEQKKNRAELLSTPSIDCCYVAPTSFGKSSLMIDLINSVDSKKVAIIVPTKSLLTQTYRLINENFKKEKVIFHDEMYNGESSFIAVFTQERALRLMKSEVGLAFDVLLIDEAHNLFESSTRSILLSRLIRRNRKRLPLSRIFYFSPLIDDFNNLRYEEQQNIDGKKISFNIKEAKIFEHKLDGLNYVYNRFLDQQFKVGENISFISYIIDNEKNNNFLYLRAPRKVESFAGILASNLSYNDEGVLVELASVISKNVHEDFYCVDLVKRGVLYIHGKLPDLIKEYLEYKFREISELKYLVANSVILEGVNLPIDNLYILNTYDLDAKGLTNLVGRVNRLNEVFNNDISSLKKLEPTIHFVNTEEFNRKKSNMLNSIRKLKSTIFKDKVKNPTLLNFDISAFDEEIKNITDEHERTKAIDKRNSIVSIQERESFLISEPENENDRLKASFLEAGLHFSYFDPDTILEKIHNKMVVSRQNVEWMKLDPIEKVFSIFIDGFDGFLNDKVFSRLKNIQARNYYRIFVKNIHALNLKDHINLTVRYFYSNAKETRNNIFYIGDSYGEVNKDGEVYGAKKYIDLSTKSHKELVNLALVKLKMESDFVSYTLNEYVSLLKEFEVISEDDYNIFVYGTSKKRNTDLTKLGLSGALIKKLDSDNQIENINVDKYGHVSANQLFLSYLNKQDDLIKFEIMKYLPVSL
ncbi:DEAD/DEAH box helicase [Pseudoalteromonas flavipulchra]|nr:DEAD/DEAH box helicase [Pseudoalteromonas flavipulchra]